VIAEDFDKAMSALTFEWSLLHCDCYAAGTATILRVLRWAVQTQARYIGMVGSRRKAITVFSGTDQRKD